MPRILKVAFLIPDLRGGGAERILIEYLRRLDRALVSPHLVVCRRAGIYLASVPKDIPVHDLDKRSRLSFPLLIRRFRRIAAAIKPDIVVSFLWYADAIQLLARPHPGAWRAVASLHSLPRRVRSERLGVVKSLLLRRIYPGFDGFMAVSGPVADELRSRYTIDEAAPIWVQPNPFPLADIRTKSRQPAPEWPVAAGGRIVAAGRLERVKGFDILLDALARIRTDRRWHLHLMGEGPQEQALKTLARAHELEHRVTFAGFIENPYPAIAGADVLVLSSRAEAFPSVLIEALILGTPVIAARCPTGPAEILGNGRYGQLIAPEDSTELADAITRALNDRAGLEVMRTAALAHVGQWDAAQVVKTFEQHLFSLATAV